MDRTDVILIQHLLLNSRVSYRELADKLDISVNAVHKRVQGLIDSGVIHRFTTKVSLVALGAVAVVIYGPTLEKMDDIAAELRKDDRIYWISQASGGMLYVGGYLHNIGELEDFVSSVRKVAGIDSPQVGILAAPPAPTDRDLSRLDYRIIQALSSDSRQAVSDVAEALSTSAKTVRRRLAWMTEQNLIECTLEWYPDKSNDIISMFHLRLEPGVDRYPMALSLMSRHSPAVLFFFLFSNQPDTLLLGTWSSTMSEMNELRRRLEREEGVASSIPHILYTGEVYETWRERLAEERGGRGTGARGQ